MDMLDMHGVRAMTLDEYIVALQLLKLSHPGAGSLPVQKWMPGKARHSAPPPEIAYEKGVGLFAKGERRQITPAFWQPVHDFTSDKGDPVIRV